MSETMWVVVKDGYQLDFSSRPPAIGGQVAQIPAASLPDVAAGVTVIDAPNVRAPDHRRRLIVTIQDGRQAREVELPLEAYDPGGVLTLDDGLEVSLCGPCQGAITRALDADGPELRANVPCRLCLEDAQ
jgi:hypothetical protein